MDSQLLGYFLGYRSEIEFSDGSVIGTTKVPQAGSFYSNGATGRGTSATSTIASQVTLVCALAAGCSVLKKGEPLIGSFKWNKQYVNAEFKRGSDNVSIAVLRRDTNKVSGGMYNPTGQPKISPTEIAVGARRGTQVLMAMMPGILEDSEASQCFTDAVNILKTSPTGMSSISANDRTKLDTVLGRLSDNIYFRLKDDIIPFPKLKADNTLPTLTDSTLLSLDTMCVSSEDCEGRYGSLIFELFEDDMDSAQAQSNVISGKKKSSTKDFLKNFILNPNRTFTADEQNMIPTLPQWYVIPQVAVKIASAVFKSTGMNRVIRNVMLKGPAGTGKTESAKAIAAGLNLPYTHITCSAGMELIDLLGTIVPNTDGSDGFSFEESELLKAIRNGWVCEVQEPTVIVQPGVLPGLNSLLEGGSVTLITGEVVKRHPDSVIIFTTNVDYEGCRSMNESVEDRFPLKFFVELPSDKELIERTKKVTGFTADDKLIKEALKCLKETQEYLEGLGYSTGKVGCRVLYDWIDSFQIFEDMEEAAEYTIIQSASDDADIQDYIRTNIIQMAKWPTVDLSKQII